MLQLRAKRCILTFRPITQAPFIPSTSCSSDKSVLLISTKSKWLAPNRHQTWKHPRRTTFPMAKRKSLSTATQGPALTTVPIPPPAFDDDSAPPPKRRASQRKISQAKPATGSTNPNENANVLDAPGALRASPDADEPDERIDLHKAGMDVEKQVKEDDEDDDSLLSEISEVAPSIKTERPKSKAKVAIAAEEKTKEDLKNKASVPTKEKKDIIKEPQFLDPEAEGDEEADEEEIQAALSRPPPVNSDYLPLPWKGRLGYVSMNDSFLRR